MATEQQFVDFIAQSYTFTGIAPQIGCGIYEAKTEPGAKVHLPIKMMNRHGLIAGATGTGKTKTLQMLAEFLSDYGVPSLVLDVKGDLSGVAEMGATNSKIEERYKAMELTYTPAKFPAELLSLTGKDGTHMRATVTEFGPILFSKILGLNDTQGGIMAMIFKYCDDNDIPLVDLDDVKDVLKYISEEGKATIEKDYGKISTTSSGTILRKVIELEEQGGNTFFGELSFDVQDLLKTVTNGSAVVNVLRVNDIQDKPKLFSSFMLQLLAEVYATFPEVGDMDKPKFVMFIDEAHLIFEEASDALINMIETVIRLIRSKGVGIFFCTQSPTDIPASVLGQLGMKFQHALRAFTAADRKAIKQAAENYPLTDYYQTDVVITQLGIGEALVTLLNDNGIPTPLVQTMLCTPRSSMNPLTQEEINTINGNSTLYKKYENKVDKAGAREILAEKITDVKQQQEQTAKNKATEAADKKSNSDKNDKGFFDNSLVKSFMRTAGNTLVRSLLGSLGVTTRRRRR